MEADRIQVHYKDPLQLLRDLKMTGAKNNLTDRSRGLLGRARLHKLVDCYQNFRLSNEKYPATYEVIYGHAWKRESARVRGPDPDMQWQPIRFS